jgi:sec-independent protein translocase protein TatC
MGIGAGLAVAMPLVLLVLVRRGLLTHQDLARARRLVMLWNFMFGLMLPTPEIIRQAAMVAILQALYEASVWLTWYWEWLDKRLR